MAESINGRSNGLSVLGDSQPNLAPGEGPWIPLSTFHRPSTNNSKENKQFFFELPCFSHQDSNPQQTGKHQRMSSSVSLVANAQNATWLHEFTELPASKRPGMHRRFASDSLAFVDANAGLSSLPHSEISDRDAFDCGSSSTTSIPSKDFDTSDEDQLVSILQGQDSVSLTNIGLIGSRTPLSNSEIPCTPSDQVVETKTTFGSHPGSLKTEHEAQRGCLSDRPRPLQQQLEEKQDEEEQKQALASASNASGTMDISLDPKRVKRILANRQSAQRSRIRKLHYIAKLESSVNSLQAEVSALSPQVAYLDHQRLILNLDNSALKQRIAALAQDELFKDAHLEILSKEVQRLRYLYQQQCVQTEEHSQPIGLESEMQHDNGISITDGTEASSK